jgi:predicted Zn finger-like uncharacterized protein
LKSKIKCGNCGSSFLIDENDLEEGRDLKCPECRQPLGEKFIEQLKNAFKTLHAYQR